MFKPKPIAIAASIGFVLSFVIGLCCKVNIGFVFLRAFIFAVLSGGICFGIMFVVQKFLKDSESVPEAPPAESSESSSEIEVTEEVLPDDDSSPEFFVSQADIKTKPGVQRFSPSKKEASSADESSSADEKTIITEPTVSSSKVEKSSVSQENKSAPETETFRPVSLVKETVQTVEEVGEETSVVDAESVPEESSPAANADSPKKASSSLDGILDELPDLGSSLNSDDAESEVESSDISSYTPSTSSSSSVEGMGQDSETVAQAIRTMLSRD